MLGPGFLCAHQLAQTAKYHFLGRFRRFHTSQTAQKTSPTGNAPACWPGGGPIRSIYRPVWCHWPYWVRGIGEGGHKNAVSGWVPVCILTSVSFKKAGHGKCRQHSHFSTSCLPSPPSRPLSPFFCLGFEMFIRAPQAPKKSLGWLVVCACGSFAAHFCTRFGGLLRVFCVLQLSAAEPARPFCRSQRLLRRLERPRWATGRVGPSASAGR